MGNNGNPAGDGQAGDAGEGRRGTDRHNLVELRSRDGRDFGASYPAPWESNTLFKNMVNVYQTDSNYWAKTDQGNAASAGTQDGPGLSTWMGLADTDRAECWDNVRQSWAVRMATAGHYGGFDSK